MRRRIALLLLGLLALGALAALIGGRDASRPAPPAAQAESAGPAVAAPSSEEPEGDEAPDPPPPLALTGIITDARDGRPVGGALVAAECGAARAETTTGADGRFSLTLLPGSGAPGTLRVEAEGFLAHREDAFWSGEYEVSLRPVGREVMGRVVDVADRPVPGARVRVGAEGPYVADAAGRFGPVPVGSEGWAVEFTAWADGFAATEGSVDPGESGEILVVLPAAVVSAGVVVDRAGLLVTGAVVRWLRGPGEHAARTGADGRFQFPLAPGETATLFAMAGEWFGCAQVFAGAPTRIVLDRVRDPRRPIRAPMPPPEPPLPPFDFGRLRAFVIDQDGKPVAGARLWFSATFGSQPITLPLSDGQACEDGSLDIDVPLIGEVTIGADGEGASGRTTVSPGALAAEGRPLVATVTLVPRQRVVEPAPGPPFRVVVLDAEGRPVQGALVWARWGQGERTDARGEAAVPSLAGDGERVLVVEAEGYPPQPVAAAAGGPPVSARLPPRGAVRVRLDGKRGDPGPPDIRLWADRDLRETFLEHELTPFLLDEGNSLRIDLPAGEFALAIRAEPGEWVFFGGVRVIGGRETELRYAFPRFKTVAVRVLDPAGEPEPDATVFVAETGFSLGAANVEGRLEWDCSDPLAPAGVVHLLVCGWRGTPVLTGPVDSRRGASLTVTAGPAGERMAGTVADAEGRPLPNASLLWLREDGPPVDLGSSWVDATFIADFVLPPGPVRLRIEAGKGRRGELTVSPRDSDLRVDLR